MAWKQRGWGGPAHPAVPLRGTAKLMSVGWVTILLKRLLSKENGAVLRQLCVSMNTVSVIWEDQPSDTSIGLWVLPCWALWHRKSIAVIVDKSSSPKLAELRAPLSNAWLVQIHLGGPGKLQALHPGAFLSLTNVGCPVMSISAQSVCKFCSSSWTKHSSYEAHEGLWVIRSPLKHCGIPLLSNLTNILCSARHSGQDPTPLLLVICNLGA